MQIQISENSECISKGLRFNYIHRSNNTKLFLYYVLQKSFVIHKIQSEKKYYANRVKIQKMYPSRQKKSFRGREKYFKHFSSRQGNIFFSFGCRMYLYFFHSESWFSKYCLTFFNPIGSNFPRKKPHCFFVAILSYRSRFQKFKMEFRAPTQFLHLRHQITSDFNDI